MSNHESSNPAFDATDTSPISSASNNGALVPQSAMSPTPVAMGPTAQRVDVIRGGLDGASLYHSFRRRWLLAIGLGMLLGATVAVALFLVFPESSNAVTMFRINSEQDTVLTSLDGNENFEIYRRTHEVAVKSPYVLNAALDSLGTVPLIKEIPLEERVQWLQDNLRVSFVQDSEIMQISLAGSSPPSELEAIIDAVSQAYIDEVVTNEKLERLKPLDILRSSERKLNEEIKRKTDAYYALLKESGSPDSFTGMDPETTLLMAKARDLAGTKVTIEQALAELKLRYDVQRSQLTDPAVLEYRINQAIQADPQMIEMRAGFNALQMQADSASVGVRGGANRAGRQMQAQVQMYADQIARYEQQLRKQFEETAQAEPDMALKQLQYEFQMTNKMYTDKLADTNRQLDEAVETLKSKGEINTDIEMRKAALEQLRAVAASIAKRIDEWAIEAEAPDRVTRMSGVEKTPGINRMQRYAITGIGGLATFAFTCFGIAYLEFHNRRLNGPEQVDEGLGIRVIGTLPSLGGRKTLNSNHPVVAQLTESIDSVRTALMHESTTNRRQVVLVTSAAAMEGRTTVASQLAASLARAGRRTLLVDGDLRRPSLHKLFDVPLEDGLCEVLRTESEIADVVSPTHAEGLWLMTAGFCDADAVHALATDQAQPIFDKLRSDYDFIIIDGAPVLGLADSLLFGQHCDGAVLSVLRDHTNVPKIHQSSELLRSVGIRLVGAVVNGVPIKADRRVTHLQVAGSKSARKQLEQAGA